MKAKGLISNKEFQAKKKELLTGGRATQFHYVEVRKKSGLLKKIVLGILGIFGLFVLIGIIG